MWGVALLPRLAPERLALKENITVNWTVLCFAFGIALFVALVLGLAAALRTVPMKVATRSPIIRVIGKFTSTVSNRTILKPKSFLNRTALASGFRCIARAVALT